jgi:hypothetical protein
VALLLVFLLLLQLLSSLGFHGEGQLLGSGGLGAGSHGALLHCLGNGCDLE